jgi:hypothetical protein
LVDIDWKARAEAAEAKLAALEEGLRGVIEFCEDESVAGIVASLDRIAP